MSVYVQGNRLICGPVSRPALLERYSHEGYLIKVVVMALAGEVTRELSPILSWSNKDYDLKLGEKARGQELHIRSAVDVVMF